MDAARVLHGLLIFEATSAWNESVTYWLVAVSLSHLFSLNIICIRTSEANQDGAKFTASSSEEKKERSKKKERAKQRKNIKLYNYLL